MENSVLVPQKYGKIRFSFDKVMDAKQVNRNQLASRAGIRFEVADRFYNGNIERMDMDVLAKICFALNCDVSELMRYDKQG